MNSLSAAVKSKYTLLGLLGSGGMGSVYKARHEYTGELGALKLLHRKHSADARSVTRFLREAKTVSLVQSPNIVRVKDAGRLEPTRPFIFMELLEGFTLKSLLRSSSTLPLSLVCELLRQAAEGLGAAHSVGIVHRDVKPDNLFLVVESASALPSVKLLDFGICKLDAAVDEHTAVTRQGAPLGTPGYMAPEQFYDSASVDQRADVYALGVVAYQCLTGRTPFSGLTVREQCEAAHAGRYPGPRSLKPDLPVLVDEVIGQALAARVEQRYPTCTAFAEALSGAIPEAAPNPAQVWAEVSREVDVAIPASGAPAEPARVADLSQTTDAATVVPLTSWYGGVQAPSKPARRRRLLRFAALGLALSTLAVLLVLAAARQRQGTHQAKLPSAKQPNEPTAEVTATETTADAAVTKVVLPEQRPPSPASSVGSSVGGQRGIIKQRSALERRATSDPKSDSRHAASSDEPEIDRATESNRFVKGKFGSRFVREFQ